MKEYHINPCDILQIQTKPIQYSSNMALSFHREGNAIIAQRNEEYSFVTKRNGTIVLDSLARTITDTSVLVHHIRCIEKALHKEELEDACLALPELLPPLTKETSIFYQRYRLLCLYCLYQCVVYLVWNLPITNQVAIDHMRECVQPVSTSTESLCWSFVSYVDMMLQDQAIHVLTIVNPPTIREVLHTESLYNALIYQLLMHIAAGAERTTGSYAACASCGSTFFRKHKQKKYCKDCDKPSERVKACRAKERKEAANAQENHP